MSRGTHLLVVVLSLAGCAHLQSTERLEEARTVYQKAQQGPAATASPADLATAKKFLELAEKGLESGDPKLVDDRATVAILKVQAAETLGRTHQLAAERDQTLMAVGATKQRMLEEAQQNLAQARVELEREKVARDAAEARLEESRTVLARTTEIRDLAEGTVITLPGGQLFEPGRTVLLPAGRDQLTRVAEFLKAADRHARVEAQPASRGKRSSAVALSGRRAEQVRDFLVGEGVTADQIRTGSPSRKPPRAVAASPEFAANGAVDIVLEPARANTGGTTTRGRP
jgi:outer membrane protein OmpA-like peptidoglycan-associated protein